ncbi:nucleolar transcription factor 1-A isoform X2 [Cherax quadricarinatus]|uniref:nucleolar transcription factor 1-A isoform X2 n=1 Tax=Cherax quadricarinatus TaxID=27406 RepID=UPI00387E7350
MVKFLSQVDSEASVTPMLDILKEKKKKKKVKEVEESEYTTYENLQPEEPEELLPKKKKKKKRKHEENWETTNLSMDNQEDVEAENQIMETAVKEKTKKKKKHRLENEVQEENAGFIKPEECKEKMQSEVSLPQTPETTRVATPKKRPLDQESTSKKKKCRSLDLSNEQMNIEPEEDAGKDEILESQSWTKDDKLRLLNNMKAQLPRKDKESYSTRLKDIDWEKAAFGNFTAGDCKSHFEEILTEIKSVKTLAMVLDEVTENMTELDLKKRKVLLPIHRLIRDNSDRSHKKQFTNGGNGFVNLAKAWKNLPEEEKEAYRKPFQEELGEERAKLPSKYSHRNKMRKQCPVDLPRSPLKIWINEERKLPYKEAMTYKEWKQKFQNLEKEDKLKHIIASLREFYEYKKSADEYLEKNPDFVFPIIQGPNKSDVQLFLEYRRMPVLPPIRPSMMYYHELEKAGELDQFFRFEKVTVALERYKNLPSSRKLHYKSLLDKKMEKYRMQMDAWEENQDELTLFMRARLLPTEAEDSEKNQRG